MQPQKHKNWKFMKTQTKETSKKSHISINIKTFFNTTIQKQKLYNKIENLRKPKWDKQGRKNSHPHLVAEGAETLHAAGREVALVTFKTTPNWALLLKASQRQEGAVLSTDFKPEQQVPSGFVVVLPFVTKDKQSAIVKTRFVQSTDGAGAWWVDAPWDESRVQIARTKRMSESFDAIFGEREWEREWRVCESENVRSFGLWGC